MTRAADRPSIVGRGGPVGLLQYRRPAMMRSIIAPMINSKNGKFLISVGYEREIISEDERYIFHAERAHEAQKSGLMAFRSRFMEKTARA